MTQLRGERCVWSREGRGAEAKAVKGERPTPLMGKSREHLRARLGGKLHRDSNEVLGRDQWV